MKFQMISRDPNGVYVGYDNRGWLWYWVPQRQQWMVLYQEDGNETYHGN
jgi:hypothetical protein